MRALAQHFRGNWAALDELEATLVDAILRRSRQDLSWISVDKIRLKDSFEAWVYVKLNPKKSRMHETLIGFDDSQALLIWQNSD